MAEAGLSTDIRVHDLRHTGNTFAAETGASLAELMNRMGHSSTRAAMIYLHTRDERDREIASTMDKMVKRELKRSQPNAKKANQTECRGAPGVAPRTEHRKRLALSASTVRPRAGDGNRTRAVSLGIVGIWPSIAADLACDVIASDPC